MQTTVIRTPFNDNTLFWVYKFTGSYGGFGSKDCSAIITENELTVIHTPSNMRMFIDSANVNPDIIVKDWAMKVAEWDRKNAR